MGSQAPSHWKGRTPSPSHGGNCGRISAALLVWIHCYTEYKDSIRVHALVKRLPTLKHKNSGYVISDAAHERTPHLRGEKSNEESPASKWCEAFCLHSECRPSPVLLPVVLHPLPGAQVPHLVTDLFRPPGAQMMRSGRHPKCEGRGRSGGAVIQKKESFFHRMELRR